MIALRLRALAAVVLDQLGVASLRELELEEELKREKRRLLAADDARVLLQNDATKWQKRARAFGRKASARAKEIRRRDVAGAELNARARAVGIEARAIEHVRREVHRREQPAELAIAFQGDPAEIEEAVFDALQAAIREGSAA